VSRPISAIIDKEQNVFMTNSITGRFPPYPEIPAPKPDIRLIALDLDDTLLTSDCTLSPRTKRTIQKAQGQGLTVTLATGRMYVSALPFARELAIDGPLITYNGALIIMTDGRVVSHHPIDHQLSMELLDFLQPYGHHINVYLGDELFIEEMSPEAERYGARINIQLQRVPSHREMLKDRAAGATKLTLIALPSEVEQVTADLQARFGSRILTLPSKPDFLELNRRDTSKGQALAGLAAQMGIDRSQVMAIGDSPNDLDMIEYAGWGIAMANAADAIKEKARWITAANDDDGAAIAIECLALK
jgi:Cof subfamily protein (haloacid dehalogenase superfamily)